MVNAEWFKTVGGLFRDLRNIVQNLLDGLVIQFAFLESEVRFDGLLLVQNDGNRSILLDFETFGPSRIVDQEDRLLQFFFLGYGFELFL